MKTKDLLFYIFIAITYIKLDYLFLERKLQCRIKNALR